MKLLAFDVETAGVKPEYALQPFRATLAQTIFHGTSQAWLTCFAIATFAPVSSDRDEPLIHAQAKLAPPVETLRKCLMSWASSGYTIVGWNIAFDVAWLIALGLREEVLACKWLDAMLLKRHVLCRTTFDKQVRISYKLKDTVAEEWPQHAGYDFGVDFTDTTPEGLSRLAAYNKLDAKFTLRLAQKYIDLLTPRQLRAALLEASCIPMIAETMVEGIAADPDACVALSSTLEDTLKLAFVQLKMADPEHVTPEVLASPKQLANLLYKEWGLPVVLLTDKGAPSTDKESLAILGVNDERAGQVRAYREAQGNRSKFVEGTLTSLAYNGDGHVRPGPAIFGTYTGRMTYYSKQGKGKAEVPTGVPIHQWKRAKEFRSLLLPPEGHTLIEHDFAGQEFRWMAVESGDYRMLQLCMPGEDAHAYMGARFGGKDYGAVMRANLLDEEWAVALRRMGKVGNLSLQYRTSPNTLVRVAAVQHRLKITDAEAKALHATYRTGYVGMPPYWKRQIAAAKVQGWVETQAGRRIQLGTVDTWAPGESWSYESTAINFPVQGVGADQKYLALLALRDYLPRVDGRLYFELHDGLFTVVPDAKAERAAVEMKHILSNLPYEKAWGRSFPIQFPVDAKMGKSWGALKEVHG